ncbi:translation initiation factor IF-6 [Candidatus Marsarchaeota archaeon]|jgi:translation initiation factor 6|nr:translation initiation factor IF-6 [Candidatus Marsarchaeota archaeon]MCL5090270.1 translation initiation factor IF-6 [Candidatus Marsarchaeota archaeon]
MNNMKAVRSTIFGSDLVGAFATATDRYVFVGYGISKNKKELISSVLNVEYIELSVDNSNLVGIFMRGNSKGLLVSNLMSKYEVSVLKEKTGMEVSQIESPLNTIGNNIIANDKIAVVNPDYDKKSIDFIRDALDVEVVSMSIGGFKTVGANNILTNKGFAINNHCTDNQKEILDKLANFDSIRTTANTGALGIGISTISNSHGCVVGNGSTGFEFVRILEALNIEG